MYADEDRQSALTRALIMAGAAMTQGGPGGVMGALGRGGMMGMQAYDQTYDDIAKRRIQEEQQRQLALKAKMDEIGLTRQEALAKLFGQQYDDQAGGGAPARPAPRPSMMDDSSWASNPMSVASPSTAPSTRTRNVDGGSRQEALIRALAAGGFQNEAKAQLEIFKGLEGEVYGDPQVDRNGRTFVNTKRGPRYLDGGQFVPRDKLVETDVGDRKVFRTEYDLTPRGEYQKGMTPGEKAANALGLMNYFKPTLTESGSGYVATSPDGKGGVRSQPTNIPRKADRLPSADADKVLQLDELMSQTAGARDALGKNPDAIGTFTGRMPSWALSFGNVANVDTRAKLADLSTKIMNMRSGAAVTEPEFRRLEPFLASQTDQPHVAKAKLGNLMKTLDGIQEGRRSFYASQGYNVPPSQYGGRASPGNMSQAELAAAIEAEITRRRSGK